MPWRGPEHEGEFPSLGWVLLDWFGTYLPSPADEAKPFILTDEQAVLFVRWYALDPEAGEFIYRRGASEMAKGWGKSPVWGANAIAELAGPVRFGGWDARGEPVGMPWGVGDSPAPWVQIAAVSEDQTDNTYSAIHEMLTGNDGRAADELGIDVGLTRLYLPKAHGKLEPVTSRAGSREGQRVTFGVLDETHLWTTSNGGPALAQTLRRNAAKMGGRTFETTNAPAIGDKSVAELTARDAVTKPAGILYHSRRPAKRPEPGWTDKQLKSSLREAYGDAWWIDLDRLVNEIRDPGTRWQDALRYYFNIPVASTEQWLPPGAWEALKKSQPLTDGDEIALGFCGTYNSVSAALVAAAADGAVYTLAVWDSDVDHTTVDAVFRRVMGQYRVVMAGCNSAGWEAEREAWAETFGEDVVVEWDLHHTRKFADACAEFYTAVTGGTLAHDRDPRLALHLSNAKPREMPEGAYFTSAGEPVTAAKAAVIAWTLSRVEEMEPMIAWA